MPIKRLLALLLTAALLVCTLSACTEQTEESGDVSRASGTDADALAQVSHYLEYYKEKPSPPTARWLPSIRSGPISTATT